LAYFNPNNPNAPDWLIMEGWTGTRNVEPKDLVVDAASQTFFVGGITSAREGDEWFNYYRIDGFVQRWTFAGVKQWTTEIVGTGSEAIPTDIGPEHVEALVLTPEALFAIGTTGSARLNGVPNPYSGLRYLYMYGESTFIVKLNPQTGQTLSTKVLPLLREVWSAYSATLPDNTHALFVSGLVNDLAPHPNVSVPEVTRYGFWSQHRVDDGEMVAFHPVRVEATGAVTRVVIAGGTNANRHIYISGGVSGCFEDQLVRGPWSNGAGEMGGGGAFLQAFCMDKSCWFVCAIVRMLNLILYWMSFRRSFLISFHAHTITVSAFPNLVHAKMEAYAVRYLPRERSTYAIVSARQPGSCVKLVCCAFWSTHRFCHTSVHVGVST
jgi:hypothetical protein